MLRIFKADLHIHTCLSPCAELSMSPRAIVEAAGRQRLDVIAISDHNSCENALAVIRAAGEGGIKVLPGMEVTSREEVHVLALFEAIEAALALQDAVYAHLPGENDSQRLGLQVVVNEHHDVVGFNHRLLAGATELSVEQIADLIHGLNGLAIASHIDREAFGIIGQLGFIPEGLAFDALELSANTSREEAARRFPEHAGAAFIHSSDAHRPEEIGRTFTPLLLREPTTAEVRKAFRREEDRRILRREAAGCGARRQEGCCA